MLLAPISLISIHSLIYNSIILLGVCTPSIGDATDCAIVQSAIYVTADVDQVDKARKSVLTLIKNRFESGTYVQGTIIHTTYLGPDLDELALISDSLEEKSGGFAHPTLFYVAIGVLSLAGCALVACLAMMVKVHKERRKAASPSYSPGHRYQSESKLASNNDLLRD